MEKRTIILTDYVIHILKQWAYGVDYFTKVIDNNWDYIAYDIEVPEEFDGAFKDIDFVFLYIANYAILDNLVICKVTDNDKVGFISTLTLFKKSDYKGNTNVHYDNIKWTNIEYEIPIAGNCITTPDYV